MNKHVLLLDHAHRFCLNIAAGFQCARSIFYHRPLAAAIFLILTGFVPSILPAGAASFFCGNSKNTLVEKYICANHEISQLDFQLGIINQQSLDVSEDKVAIQRQQHEWLTRKRDICRDEQCVKTAYTARIKELKIALYGRRPDILRWADPVNPVPIDPSDRPTLDLSGISIGATILSQPRGTQALLLDFGGGNSITYNGGFRDGGQIYQFAGDELNQQQIMQYLTTPVFLIGTGIADTIYGSNHNDNLYGHTGNETHPDNADHLYGQGGDDILEGGLGDDTLDGGEGNDRLLGQPGNDTLLGGLGDDRLFGNEGNDILDGGANNDYLEGGAGSDTYIFGRASGYDTLTEEESANMDSIDTIELDAGILPADVTLSRDGWDLVLALDQGPVQLRMRSFFETSTTHNKRIERVVFHDGPAGTVGTVWDAATIKVKTLSGTPNEQLSSLRRGVGLYRCGVIRPLTATLGVGVNFEIRDGIITEFNAVSSLSGSEFSQGYTNTCVKHLGEFGQSKDGRGHILQLKTSDDQYGESLNCQVHIKDINSKFRVYSSKCLSECMKFDFEVSKTGKECYYEP